MTLCGWKIFSKGKQKVKQAKAADASCSATTESAPRTLQVTSASASVAVSGFNSGNHLKGESPSLAQVATEDASSWDDGEWTIEAENQDEVDEGEWCFVEVSRMQFVMRLESSVGYTLIEPTEGVQSGFTN